MALLVAVVWGFNFVAIEWGMHDVPPLLFLAIRFLVVLIPAVFFLPKPDLPWSRILLIGGFMSLGQFGLLYLSLHSGMPAGLAGLVLQAQVPLTMLISAVALGERPSTWQTIGIVAALCGLVTIACGVVSGSHVTVIALVLCLLAATSWAIGNVVVRASRAQGGLALTVWSGLVVPIPALLLSLVVDGPQAVGAALAGFGWHQVLSTLFTAVLASLLGYGIFNSLLARYPTGAVVPWILLVPVVSMVSAWWALGQRPTVLDVVGGAVLICGALIALRAAAAATRTPKLVVDSIP